MKRLTFALSLLLLAGCATYVPAQLDQLPVGGPVRVRLNNQGSANLPAIAGVSADRVAGTLVRRSSTEVVIHVPIEIGSPFGQDLTIPSDHILMGEIRKPNNTRTMLAVGAGMGILVGVILSTRHGGQMSEPLSDNTDHNAAFTARPGSSQTSLPLISIPVP